ELARLGLRLGHLVVGLDERGLGLLRDLLGPAVVVAPLLLAPDVLLARELEERALLAFLAAFELELAEARDVRRRRIADLARELEKDPIVHSPRDSPRAFSTMRGLPVHGLAGGVGTLRDARERETGERQGLARTRFAGDRAVGTGSQ